MIPERAEADEPQHRVYRSALGRGAFWRTFPFAVVALFLVHRQSDLWGWATSVALVVGVGALAAWILFGPNYRIEDGALKLRYLFRRVRIPLSRITAVRPRTTASAHGRSEYALGTAAIEIDEAGWATAVSPRDEKAFLADLAAALQADAASGRDIDSPPTGTSCFRSVIGKRHRFLMTGSLLGLAGIGMAAASLFDMRDVPGLALLALVVAAASVEFSRWVFRGVQYTVEDGTLVVRRRWGSRRIPQDAITGVDRIDYAGFWALSANLGNDFALGTDVLAIRCGGDVAVYVSPPDEDMFLRAIGHSAPASRSAP